MASGLAVVASQVGGMLDYLVHEENALFAPPEHPEALAGCIGRLIDDPALRARLGRAGRATVERSFDEGVVFGQTAELFLTLSAGART